MFSHMRVLRFGLKTHIFYLNTQPNVCVLSHIWSKVLSFFLSFSRNFSPNFRGAFTTFTFLSRGMKQIPRFFLNGEEHSFLPSDRQYTLQRSYFVPPLFSSFSASVNTQLAPFFFPKTPKLPQKRNKPIPGLYT